MTAGWAVLGQNPARLGMAHTQATVDAMPLHDLCLISLGCSPFSPANRSPVEGAVDDHMRELAGTMRAAVRGEPAVANAIADGVPSPIRTAVRSAVDLTAYTWGMCGEESPITKIDPNARTVRNSKLILQRMLLNAIVNQCLVKGIHTLFGKSWATSSKMHNVVRSQSISFRTSVRSRPLVAKTDRVLEAGRPATIQQCRLSHK